jgi:hypothetical protein
LNDPDEPTRELCPPLLPLLRIPLCTYVKQQTVELTFQKDKLKQMREENSVLNGEVTLLKGKLNKQSSDADDILTHKQREISQKVERVNGLEVGFVTPLPACVRLGTWGPCWGHQLNFLII